MSYQLSPGTRWQDKLKLRSESEVLAWRQWWLKRSAANRRVREALRETCKHDLLWYTNLFVWQYNPKRLGQQIGVFWTWPFQDRTFQKITSAITNQVNMVVQKSRDMGLSWMFNIVSDWLCLFHPNMQILMISRNADAVDCESPDSLFWKIDFIHKNLPEWLIGGEIRRRVMYFGYPNGSSITGEASTGKAGVGGRASMILVDEFSQIRDDWEVLHRTSDTADCRMFNGTHLGMNTAFAKLCFDRESFPDTSWIRETVHWTEHPRKRRGRYRFNQETNLVEVVDPSDPPPSDHNFVRTPAPVGGPFPGIRSPWYDRACGDKGSARAVAMDLDINPMGSVAQVFDPVKVALLNAAYCCAPFWEGDMELDDNGRLKRLHYRPQGPLRLWLTLQRDQAPPGDYKLGCDVAVGTGATPSCCAIVNATLGEKVGSYTRADLAADTFAKHVAAIGWWLKGKDWEEAQLAWEMPGPGLLFSATILKLGYRNIYYRSKTERTGPRLICWEEAETPGWFSTYDSKRWLIDRYRAAVESKQYITREREELEEALKFKWTADGRSMEHANETNTEDSSTARVNHGDRVIAAALAWMLAEGVGRIREIEKEETGPPVGSFAWRRSLRQNGGSEPEEPPLWIDGVEYR